MSHSLGICSSEVQENGTQQFSPADGEKALHNVGCYIAWIDHMLHKFRNCHHSQIQFKSKKIHNGPQYSSGYAKI